MIGEHSLGERPRCTIERMSPARSQCTITVPPSFVESIYTTALRSHQTSVVTQGFPKGATPLSYIESICKSSLIAHLREFLFHAYAYPALHETLIREHCVLYGEPALRDVHIEPPSTAIFRFDLTHCEPLAKKSWRDAVFKIPGRKNYKDLDRQVETFVREEAEREKHGDRSIIGIDDWVLCSIEILSDEGMALMEGHSICLWIKMADEEVDQESREICLGKKPGDQVVLRNSPLFTSYFSPSWNPHHTYRITFIEHSPSSAFILDEFKAHFGIKNPRDVHVKLIEVFSFRNDICQRREIIEAAFKMLRDVYSVQPPTPCIEQQERLLIEQIQTSPDYHVYKSQGALFKKILRELAIKQLSEMAIVDYLTAAEHTVLAPQDIATYFNLLKRPRTRQFVYFDVPTSKVDGREWFVPHSLVKRQIIREKTLNGILNYSMKR